MDLEPPALPPSRLEGGWTLSKEYVETVFDGLGVTVEGQTLVYEDETLRERLVAAGGTDRVWRFFFVSRLDISPSPGFGMETVARPHVVRESKANFTTELRERGFEDVEIEETNRVRIGDHRGDLTPYRARLDADGTDAEIVGALAVWFDGAFHIAGGAYPESGLEPWVDVEADAYEAELLEMIRATAASE